MNTKWGGRSCDNELGIGKWELVALCEEVISKGYPNAWGARIPLKPWWNLSLLDSLLGDYEDKEIVQWIKFSWPVSRPPNWKPPQPSFENHASATDFPSHIDKYLEKEINRETVVGPFETIPFVNRVGVSPLSIREKKDSEDRCIIMDLSWPIGNSVNSGIAKDRFMGFHCKLTFSTSDVIAKRVAELMGVGLLYLFKVDLSGYFRQLPLDPGDYSLLCFTWGGKFTLTLCPPWVSTVLHILHRECPMHLTYIHNQASYFLFNYIDDFIGVELLANIHSSMNCLTRMLNDIGVKKAISKRVEPTQNLNCIGTMVDAKKGILYVLPERREALLGELQEWLFKDKCSIKDVQRLVGKLQFICAVVRPGRLFMSRMLDMLREVEKGGMLKITQQCRLDILWWLKYLPEFDLWMMHIKQLNKILASDACLEGMGATCGDQFIKSEFPVEWKKKNIAYLELLAVVVVCKVCIKEVRGKSILIKCDNEAVSKVLNSGRARDPLLLMLMREMVFVAAGSFEFRAIYWPGWKNILPDLLSKWGESDRIHKNSGS